MRKTVEIRFYAVLREQAGRSEESLTTSAATPLDLYHELAARYGFSLDECLLRVSVNDRYADMHGALKHGDRVTFIPPVAGG